jgi:hypothetical protein
MLSGRAFRHQLWAPAIGVIGGGVLPTPQARDHRVGSPPGSPRWERKAAAGWSPNLNDIAPSLPTPKAGDGERGRDKARARPDTKGRELATVVRDQTLPTPRANSAMTVDLRTQQNRPELQPNLETVVARMLPTPNAGEAKQSGNVQNWQRRQLEHAATGQDLQIPLAVAVKLLPTPTTNDSKNASLPPSQAERDGLAGAMLRDDSIPTGAATYLNPSFVEEMMGFPVGWTA